MPTISSFKAGFPMYLTIEVYLVLSLKANKMCISIGINVSQMYSDGSWLLIMNGNPPFSYSIQFMLLTERCMQYDATCCDSPAKCCNSYWSKYVVFQSYA